MKKGTSDVCGWDLYNVCNRSVKDSGLIVPSRRSWIHFRTIGNFSGACFSASFKSVIRKVRHLATKSLICWSVNFAAGTADGTVWRTTGWGTSLFGMTVVCCWRVDITGSTMWKIHFILFSFNHKNKPVLMVGENWIRGDPGVLLFVQTVWGTNWLVGWFKRTIFVWAGINPVAIDWTIVLFEVLAGRIFVVLFIGCAKTNVV